MPSAALSWRSSSWHSWAFSSAAAAGRLEIAFVVGSILVADLARGAAKLKTKGAISDKL